MILENWFPQNIAYVFNPNHNKIEDELSNYCLEIKEKDNELHQKNWVSKTYNKSILGVHKFYELNKWVEQQVNQYIMINGIINGNINGTKDSWFNIYNKGDFQEYHCHASFISCIYFLKSNENDAKVIFKSPVDDMINVEYDNDNNPTGTVKFKPNPGKLIIFRSYLNHCVEQKITDGYRISLAYNYNKG